jgi:hypothetical protein
MASVWIRKNAARVAAFYAEYLPMDVVIKVAIHLLFKEYSLKCRAQSLYWIHLFPAVD